MASSNKPDAQAIAAQDTFYVGTLEGRRTGLPADFHRCLCQGRFHQLYDRKTPITAAELSNDRVNAVLRRDMSVPARRMLTDRGTEYCGNPEPRVRALPRGRGHRSQPHQGQEPADH